MCWKLDDTGLRRCSDLETHPEPTFLPHANDGHSTERSDRRSPSELRPLSEDCGTSDGQTVRYRHSIHGGSTVENRIRYADVDGALTIGPCELETP